MPSHFSRSFSRFPAALGAGAFGAILIALPAQAQDPAPPVIPPPAPQSPTSWTTYKGNLQRTGSSTAKITLPLSLQWRYSSDGITRSYLNSPLVIGSPGRQRIIFAAGKLVYALDSQTGQQVWKSTELPAEIGTPLTLLQSDEGDFVIAAQDNGRVSALDAARGGLKWSVDTKSRVADAGPIIVTTAKGVRIICAVSNGQLVAIDSAGVIDPDWKLTLDRFGATPAASMALSPDGTRLFVSTADGRLFVIDVAAAKSLFSIRLNGRSLAAPVVTTDKVISVVGPTVLASTLDLGRPAWNYKATGDVLGSPAIGPDNTVYFGTRTGVFVALNSDDGKVKWQKAIPKASITGTPVVVGDTVMVGTSTGLMIGFDRETGDIQWENLLQTNRTTSQNIAQRRGRGGFGGFGGFGGGFDTQANKNYPISSAPAVVDGQVFVFGDNATMYALTSHNIDADPARITNPILSVPAQGNGTARLRLRPEAPSVIPGLGPITLTALIDDVGAGVDKSSITVTVDNTAVAPDRIDFDETKGLLTLTLLDVKKGDTAYDDGLKSVVIKVRDYAGNETNYQTSFVVDKGAPAPSDRSFGQAFDPTNPNFGGGGMFAGGNFGGGGMFGGMNPGGFDPNGGGFDPNANPGGFDPNAGDPNAGGFDPNAGGDPNGNPGGFDPTPDQ